MYQSVHSADSMSDQTATAPAAMQESSWIGPSHTIYDGTILPCANPAAIGGEGFPPEALVGDGYGVVFGSDVLAIAGDTLPS